MGYKAKRPSPINVIEIFKDQKNYFHKYEKRLYIIKIARTAKTESDGLNTYHESCSLIFIKHSSHVKGENWIMLLLRMVEENVRNDILFWKC